MRFRSILTLRVDGERREFSNVYQVSYRRAGRSLLGFPTSTRTWGEAIPVDLGERGRAYLMLGFYNETSASFGNGTYAYAILETWDVATGGPGGLKAEDYFELAALKGRVPFRNSSGHSVDTYRELAHPDMVAFRDESDPKSIHRFRVEDMASHFGAGVEFVSLELEITDDPVTSGELERYLPWLAAEGLGKKPYAFARTQAELDYTRGMRLSEKPFRFHVGERDFFGEESYKGISYE